MAGVVKILDQVWAPVPLPYPLLHRAGKRLRGGEHGACTAHARRPSKAIARRIHLDFNLDFGFNLDSVPWDLGLGA